MAEEIQNIFDDVVELKKLNPWLAAFALTDSEVKAIIKLISRIIIGSINISDFYSEMKKIVRKDEEMIKKITMAAINSRFVPIKGQISGVDELINQLGGLTAVEIKQNKSESDNNLKSAISFFHEDDEEIKQIVAARDLSFNVHDYASLAELIISESGYSLDGDEVIFGRLKNIIIARLKDIRDEIETLEALKKSRKIGGLEMGDDQAKKIIALVKEKISQGLLSKVEDESAEKKSMSFPAKKPFATEKITLEAKKNLDNYQPVSELKKVEEKKVEKPNTKALKLMIDEEDGLPVIKFPQGDDLMVKPKVVDLGVVKPVNKPTSQPVIDSAPVKKMENIEIYKKEESNKEEIKKNIQTPQPRPMAQSTLPPKNIRFGKKLVDGVRVGGMLVGPVEELSTMTLINFRRLGETPYQATAKLKEKIDLLEKDSYGKRLQGIDAWHKSEVNRFYRLLGQESMRQERSIDDIINERIKDNKPTLSIEEFNSVMELNKDLRY